MTIKEQIEQVASQIEAMNPFFDLDNGSSVSFNGYALQALVADWRAKAETLDDNDELDKLVRRIFDIFEEYPDEYKDADLRALLKATLIKGCDYETQDENIV